MEGRARGPSVSSSDDEAGFTWRIEEKRWDQISRSTSGFIRYPRSMGRRTAAEVRSRSAVGEGWMNFLEERGRYRQFGMTAAGSRSPPLPAFISPPPLSNTTTVDIFFSFSFSRRG